MRILILGGTAWLGGTIATAAMHHGHAVTCLARGESGEPPAGIRLVRGDRDRPGGYAGVADDDWDVVVDLARQPGQVGSAVAELNGRVGAYTFVSSTSVYADAATVGQNEGAELLPALDGEVSATPETYGEAKVACEQRVVDGVGAHRAMIVRAGLIGGPGDVSDRSGY